MLSTICIGTLYRSVTMYRLVLLSLVFVFSEGSQVLLVSMDGFRWDYLKKTSTPNFDILASRGTKAEYINNTFITKTFPCHYSIATGLYEETHGIIGNAMYDPEFNSTFKMSTTESRWWDGGEPIWVTVRKHNLKSAVYFWPGSEAEIRGYRPNYWKPYKQDVKFNDRVDQVIKWLTDKIDFVALYFHEPDATGHLYGPDSSEVIDKVKYMDSILGYIMGKFDSSGLWDKVNFILTSDHGMSSIDTENKAIDISEHVNMSKILFTVDNGPVMQVHPKKGQIDYVVNSLKYVNNMTVYKKENIPDVWHYGKNRRVMPVFLLAEEGWSITKNKTALNKRVRKGTHGYDNGLANMKPIFLAAGPDIRANHTTPTFRSVDIYPMICKLLKIAPSPNNGSLHYTSNFLVTDSDANDSRNLLINDLLIALVIVNIMKSTF